MPAIRLLAGALASAIGLVVVQVASSAAPPAQSSAVAAIQSFLTPWVHGSKDTVGWLDGARGIYEIRMACTSNAKRPTLSPIVIGEMDNGLALHKHQSGARKSV